MQLKLPTYRRASGFTLIEILIVIAIIAALAGLSVAYVKESNRKARVKDTEVRIKLIEDGLTGYKNDRGEFPLPKNESATGLFFGNTYKVGGAACLYQALTGDGNDEIESYRTAKGETPGASRGEMGSTKGVIYLSEANISSKSYFQSIDNRWVLLDPFRNPFQYRPRRANDTNSEEMFNDDYDLWSYGTSTTTDDTDENRKKWITNW